MSAPTIPFVYPTVPDFVQQRVESERNRKSLKVLEGGLSPQLTEDLTPAGWRRRMNNVTDLFPKGIA